MAREAGAFMVLCLALVLVNAICVAASSADNGIAQHRRLQSQAPHRRLLQTVCKGTNISIQQSQTGTTSNGIPIFRVNIVNTCTNSCAPWNVHLYCGNFASTTLVNPNLFRRVATNDCLVNNGNGMQYGNVISFTYTNSVKFGLSFRSMQWC